MAVIVGEADGRGYWLCTSEGQVASFGSAQYDGELHRVPNEPVVGMADI